jgi:protease-4
MSMALDADVLVDRRRMRRKLTFWRGAVFVLIALAVIAGIVYASGFAGESRRSAHIARFAIDGVILEKRDELKLIEKISEAKAVKGVIISINSPGGSTTGGEALYGALRKLAEKKPVVAEIRTVGASAGYMVALSADHIVARYNSITGSIGVLFQYGNIAKLMETLGVKMDAVKSAPLKAEPDFYSDTTPEARAMLETLVKDSYDWFVALVAERRGLSDADARRVADGQIFTGHRARELKLVDTIGGEEAAVAWLETEKSVPEDLPVINWTVKNNKNSLSLTDSLARFAGEGFAKGLTDNLDAAKGLIPRGITLDGLVSVWQAPGAAQDKTTGRGGNQ